MKLGSPLVSVVASFCFLASAHADGKPVTPDMTYSSSNLARLEPLAMKGNAEAAMTLFSYYSFYRHPHTPEDDVIAMKWLNVAVDDGDPEAMLELASILHNEGGTHNCAKAVRLVRKAVTLNSESDFGLRAQRYLEEFKRSPDCAGLI